MRKSVALLTWSIWLLGSQAYAGVAMELVTAGADGQQMHRTYFYADGDRIRMDNGPSAGQPEMSTIFRGNEFVVLDHAERRYYIIDEAMINEVGAQMNAAMQEMEKQLASLPPEQRAMAEQMMKGRMPGMMGDAQPPKPRVEAIGSGEWQSSTCERYAVYEGAGKTQEICATPLDTIDGSAEAMQAFRGMAAYLKKMTDALPMGGAAGPNPGELLDEIDGFPVITTRYQSGQIAEVTTLESAGNQDIDQAVFTVPDGYERMDLIQ